jgi:histidinol-phosphatase (PHP family)
MEDYVLAAIDRGLDTIIFLEHLEAGIQYFERTWLTEEDFMYYFREGKRLRGIYKNKIRILLGVEVGYNPSAIPEIKALIDRHEWDVKGLSYHYFFDGTKHLNMVSRRRENVEALAAIGPADIVHQYFNNLSRAVLELDCDILCHIDAVMRHYAGLEFSPAHWDQVDTLLHLMQSKGMKLELNTSGFALRNTPYPDSRIVRRAIELGIPLVAGSDAHRPEQVGRYFDRLPGYLDTLT